MNKISDLRAENEALRQKIAAMENQLAWNVSARKMSTDILTESSGRFHALFETMAQGVVYQDAEGHITLANPAAERILGLSMDEMQGRSSIDPRWHAIHEDGAAFPGEQHPAMLALKTGKPVQDVVMGVFHPRESVYRWILVNAMPEFRNDEPTPCRVYTTFTDITERKQAEAALQKSEYVLKLFVEHAPAAIAMFDPQMRYIAASRRYITDFRLAEQNLAGRSHYDIFAEMDETRKEIQRCLAGDVAKCEEKPLQHADGTLDWVRYELRPWHEVNGEIGGLIFFSEMITARKQAENALRESERLLRLALETTSDGFWILDADHRLRDVNPAYCAMTGYTREEFQEMSIQDIEVLESVAETEAHVQKILSQGWDRFETRHRRKDGSVFETEISINLLDKEKGLMICFLRDITERKQAEYTLRKSNERFTQLAENISDIFWMSGPLTRDIYVSPAFEEVIGLSPRSVSQLPGKFLDVLLPEDRPILVQAREQERSGQPTNIQYRIRRPDGSIRWLRDKGNPVFNEAGQVVRVVGIVHDMTDEMEAMTRLRVEQERLVNIADTVPGLICSFRQTPQGVASMPYASPMIREIYGLEPSDVASDVTPIFSRMHPDDMGQVSESIARSAQEMVPWYAEFRYNHPQKGWLWLEGRSMPTREADGSLLWHGFITDVTERKQTEQLTFAQRDLARSIGKVASLEAGLELSFEAALQISGMECGGIYLFDPGRATLELVYHQGLSAAFAQEVARYPFESPIVQGILSGDSRYMTEADFSHVELYRAEGLKTIGFVPVSYQDQVIGCLNLAARAPVHVSDFLRSAVEVLATEIGNYVIYLQAETALRQSEANLKRAQAVAQVGSWVVHLQTRTTEWSDETHRIFGIPNVQQVTFEMFFSAIHPEDRQMVGSAWQAALQGVEYDIEHRIVRADGEIRWVHQLSEITFSPEGQPMIAMGTVQDITERKQAEAESLRRQARLEQVIQLGKNITAVTDLDQCLRAIQTSVSHGLGFDRVGLFLYDAAGQKVRGAYGTSREGQLENNSWYEDSIHAQTDWQLALQSPAGIAFDEDYQALHNPSPENEMHGVRQHVTLAAWAGDEPVALLRIDNLLSGRPITPADLEALQLFAGYAGLAIENARMHTLLEQRVRERTAEVQDLYDNAPTGYHSLDAEGCVIMVNKTELGWLGYTREEVVGRRFSDFFTPESLETFKVNFPLFKQRGWLRDLESEIIRKDGSTFHVLVSATAVNDEAGNYLMSRSTMFDNTERKQTEAALRESEETYRALFENASDAIFLLDVSTATYARLNPRCAALLGAPTSEDLLGRHAFEFIKPADVAGANDHLQALLSGQPQPTYERTFVRLDGSLVETEINLSLIRDGQGNPRYVQSVVRDISERKKAEQVLRRANLELERAMRMKDEFLASMSHELRAPLTGVLGLSEALQMKTYGDLNERQLRALKHIETSGRHLLELINDILDLSKIEAGKFDMQFEPCSLGDICQASLQLTRGMAHKKQQRVSFAIEPASLVIRADPRRLKQMLVNLLSNAIKFTPEGGSLGLEVRADGKAGVVAITVWDKGVGIAEENLKRLFKPFIQLDSSLARQHSGTGLGLSLVQRMAELHGGSVRVESAPGEGSRFTILLPWSPQATQPVRRANVGAGSLHPSLTVEDSEIDAEQITRYLRHLGIENTVHPLGRESMEVAARIKPGVILLDLHLPDMSGFEVLAALKADPRTRGIPVVICSVEKSRQKALAQGAAGYLVKPFTLNEARIELGRVASEQELQKSVLTIAPHHAIPRILVVDDNEVTLETISDFLAVQKFQVWSARSGMEALDQASQDHPDLILMDIQMPGMDGLETIRRIRAHTDSQVARTPIIALTALAMPGDRETCMEAGANEYMTKPVQLKQLAETIRAMLSLP